MPILKNWYLIFSLLASFFAFRLKLILFVLRDKDRTFFLGVVPTEDNLMLVTACQSENC